MKVQAKVTSLESVTAFAALPSSGEDEQRVIGAVLIDPAGALPLIRAAGLRAEHFADAGHRLIWGAIERIEGAGEPIGMVEVFEHLRKLGQVERVGGIGYINELMERVESTKAAGSCARVVVDKARRRELIRAADALHAAAAAESADKVLRLQVEQIIARLADDGAAGELQLAAPPFRAVPVANLASTKVHAPDYYWPARIPEGHVTVLSGHGGVGKSLAAMMLLVGMATGRPVFGVPTKRCKVALFSGEDGAELLLHRLLWVCHGMEVDPAELDGWVHVLDATDGDPTLFTEVSVDGRRIGTTTAAYAELGRYITDHGIDVLIVDNMSDTFDANEIERPKVRAFMRSLVLLRQAKRMTVLLLAHVDKGTARGERSGAESYSGSTALHNSARSRLYLSRDKDGALTLEQQKNNLGPLSPPLKLEWPEGELPRAETPSSGYAQAITAAVDLKALLRLVHEFTARGEFVSPGATSPTSAPRLLATEPGYPKGRKSPEVLAMLRNAERDGLLAKETYRARDRHERERWALTYAGRAFVGVGAGTAGTAGNE